MRVFHRGFRRGSSAYQDHGDGVGDIRIEVENDDNDDVVMAERMHCTVEFCDACSS